MKHLKTRVHPVTVALALAVVGLAIFMGYSRKPESQTQPLMLEQMRMQQSRPPPTIDRSLGAVTTISPRGRGGDVLVDFTPSREASPLGVLGCAPGDILVSVNGESVTGWHVRKAMEELEKDGKPLSLIVDRNGQKVELKHTKMPTVPAVGEMAGPRGRSPHPPKGP